MKVRRSKGRYYLETECPNHHTTDWCKVETMTWRGEYVEVRVLCPHNHLHNINMEVKLWKELEEER